MIRLSLLQFRAQAIIAVVTMAVYGALLAATGSMYTADALRGCDVGRCGNPGGYFTASLIRTPYLVLYLLSVGTILLAPAVIGLGISEAQAGPGGATFTLFALSVPGQPGAWLLSSGPVNAAGRATSSTQPLLALPVDRDHDLPRSSLGAGRVLFPAAQPPLLKGACQLGGPALPLDGDETGRARASRRRRGRGEPFQ
jgi:hypothetical protein